MIIGPKNKDSEGPEEKITMEVMVVPHPTGMINVCIYRKDQKPFLADIVTEDYAFTWGIVSVPPNPEMFDMMLMVTMSRPKKPITYH